jgi:LytS/YehU family sensor histidine kinase
VADWWRALLFAVPPCLAYGFVALSAYYVCRAQPLAQRSLAKVVGVFAAASLLSACGWLLLAAAWNALGTAFGRDEGWIALTPNVRIMLFAAGAGLYLMSLLAHDVLIAVENMQQAAAREAESRVLAREAELQALRAQINPHFLFNSLNSISALTSFDPAEARAMTIDLAQFFRQTLALSEREEISLVEELELCRHYLGIEQRRFGDKLAVDMRIDASARDCTLPPMLLQPMLENALKHGIRHLDERGIVVVEALAHSGWLHLAVRNPVAEDAPPSEGTGTGLRNIRERLGVLYGDRARMQWRREAGQFAVELAVPQSSRGEA